MNLHLAEIARQIDAQAHAVVILDQAGWHGARALVVPENLTLLPLPPYSPELIRSRISGSSSSTTSSTAKSLPTTKRSSTPAATPGTAFVPSPAKFAPSPPEHGQERSISRTVGIN